MAAGENANLTLALVNSKIGSVTNQLADAMEAVQEVKEWFDTIGAAGLQTAYGMSSNDANVVGSAINDMDKLNQIYQGLASQSTLYDFRTFIKQVWGIR